SEPAHLERSRAKCWNIQTVARDIARDLNEDVDTILIDLPGACGGAGAAQINETVAARGDLAPIGTVIVWPVGITDHPKPIAIVTLEQAAHEMGDGMIAKIAAQIADGEFLARPATAIMRKLHVEARHAGQEIFRCRLSHTQIPNRVDGA